MSKRADGPKFESEAALVAEFCSWLERKAADDRREPDKRWTAYHETAGWDLLLVNPVTGMQIGVEAKLALNAKVLTQALPDQHWYDQKGPDYRAVLVPAPDLQGYMSGLARHLGISVISAQPRSSYRDAFLGWNFAPDLPDERHAWGGRDWVNWCPSERCALPEYVPDVSGGKAAPVALTQWKVKAIKLIILLDRLGYVTRRDMKLLDISPSRWTDAYHGFLRHAPDQGGYVRNGRTPDLRAQHPVNYAQIEADWAKWGEPLMVGRPAGGLFEGAAA